MDIVENGQNLSRFLLGLEKFLTNLVVLYGEIVRREGRFESVRTHAYEPLRRADVLSSLRRQLQVPVGLGYSQVHDNDHSVRLTIVSESH